MGDDFQGINMAIGGSTPPRKSQVDTIFARSLNPWEKLAVWREAMELDEPLPMAATHSDIQRLFGPEYNKVKSGAQTMRQAADILVPQINDLLKQAKAIQS